MVPFDPTQIIDAIGDKLADVERRLASDARSLTDERHQDGVARLAALRRAVSAVRDELERSTER